MDMMDAYEVESLLNRARSGDAAGVIREGLHGGNLYALADLADEFGHPTRRVVTTGRHPHVLTTTGVRILASGWAGKA